VNTVIVGGKVVMENRSILTLDAAALAREALEQASRHLGEGQKAFADLMARVKPHYQAWYRGWEDLGLDPFYRMNSRV
jgi:hypothetical protein